MIKKIILTCNKISYPINIGMNLFDNLQHFLPLKSGERAVFITNEILASLYLEKICSSFKNIGIITDNIIIPDGEKNKNLLVVNNIYTSLIQKLYNRDTILIALGGGVIGDLTGFVAASYQRGIRLIHVPTTLLSQVDSSIGGKTAVNHDLGKNMIGFFWHPISVISDLNFLKTLPLRELSSGLAEVIKYAVALDKYFFNWIEKNIDFILHLNCHAITTCVRWCCELKSKIISLDNLDNLGLRILLNLGHTYGHAIETEIGYGNILHGEAVAMGIIMAAKTSESLGKLNKEDTFRIIKLIKRAGLPSKIPKISVKSYINQMKRDKKNYSNNNIRLVLPLCIGKSEVCNNVSIKTISDIISSFN